MATSQAASLSRDLTMSQPFQSITRVSPRPLDISSDELLNRMFTFNEKSASYYYNPVEMSHQIQAPNGSLSPTIASTLKRSHWKKSDKCFNVKCQQKFSALYAHRRNCCMCGEMFCRNCTRFRRKLSPDATPDPSLGILCQVCKRCFDSEVQDMGNSFSWTSYLVHLHKEKASSNRARKKDSSLMPISALDKKNTKLKRDRVLTEMNRLTEGFKNNLGWVKSFMSDVKIPTWHKNDLWIDSNKSHQCNHCHSSFKLMAKKINCRVCGQIFCTLCTKEEIIVFCDGGPGCVKWAINGKTGSPTVKPQSFTLLPVCNTCVKELENILVEEIEAEEDFDIEEKDFMESLNELHAKLFKIKSRIEIVLPDYEKLVDSMDIFEGAPRTTQTKNPINDLALAQSNLSDHFSHLALESQALRKLNSITPAQAKLQRNVTIGFYQFYSESMYNFRMTKYRLAEFMPIDTIEKIQQALNLVSIQRVHIFMRQITFEALNIEDKQKIANSDVAPSLVKCVETLEEEAERYFIRANENWEKHLMAVVQMVKEDFQGINSEGKKRRRLKLPHVRDASIRDAYIQYKVLTQCIHYLNESLRELDAKTPDSCLMNTKLRLKQIRDDFEKRMQFLLKNHLQITHRKIQ